MRSILSILLISVILFSCSNGNKRYNIDETTSLYYDSLTYLKSEMTLLNGIVYSEFIENGKKKRKVNGKYVNGRQEGTHRKYHEGGQLFIETVYKNGDNKKNYTKGWYKDGQLMYHRIFDNENQQTIETWYYPNGMFKSKEISIEYETISKKCWDKDGNEIKCKK